MTVRHEEPPVNDPHDPQVMPLADIADRWVVRCDCGCGLYAQYATEQEAEQRAAAAREEGAPQSERAQAVDEVRAEEGADPV